MSGIEVVGLVLGVLPLAVSLLKSYEELAAARNRLVKFEELYRKLLRDLEHEEVLFRSIIETLISPLVNDAMVNKSDLDRIVNDTSDSCWANKDIREALRQHLGDTHKQFIEVVENTNQLCMQLLTGLKFGVTDVVSYLSLEHEADTLTTELTEHSPAKPNFRCSGRLEKANIPSSDGS
jgi:hypothetical protein